MANKTLLGFAQDLCRKQGLAIPTSVVNSTDETVGQIWGLMQEEIQELATRGQWPDLRRRINFVHANAADYGALNLDDDNAPYYIDGIVPGTFYCSTTRIPVAGPVLPQDWALMLALSIIPTTYSYRIYNGYLRVYPVPTNVAGTNFSLEYMTIAVITGSDGTDKVEFSADDDGTKFPTRIVEAGLRWRWKKEKGLPYAEEQRAYEAMIADELGTADGREKISMSGDDYMGRSGPAILVSPGNWPLS